MESVRVVRFEVRPRLDSPEFDEVAGAWVNVYTTASTEQDALGLASAEVAEAGWEVLSVEEQYVLCRDEAEELPESLPYFEQALLDGVVLVFHTFPHGGEEPAVVH